MNILLVGIGGFIGSICRYLITISFAKFKFTFPIATLSVNILGSFLIGFLFAYLQKNYPESKNLYLFLTTGVLGGFTTFSAFSLENLSLIQNDKIFIAIFYIVLSISVALLASFVGYKFGNI